MKKIFVSGISLALLLVMSLTLLAGCGSQGGSDATTVGTDAESSKKSNVSSLTVWLPPLSNNSNDKEVWGGILAPFEEANGVKAEVEIVPWGNYEEKYLTGVTSKEGPDVGYMYMEMITDFINMDAVEPLDSYLTDADKSNYLYLQNGMIQGKQYCLPFVVGNAIIMAYNKNILKANGITEIPSTWDEFIEACQKIKTDTDGDGKDDVYRFIQRWGNPAISTLNSSFYPYVWQNGGSLFNEDGTELTIDNEAGRKAVQFLYDLKFKYDILPDSTTSLTKDDCINQFASGKAAFCELETKSTKIVDEAGLDWGFITSLASQTKGTFIASDSLVLMSAAEDKELTFKLIQYMLSGESMKKFHESAPFPPIAKDEEYNDNPLFKSVYVDDIEALHSLTAVKGSSKVYDMLYKNLQLMMIGQLTPDEVISETTAYSNTILQE